MGREQGDGLVERRERERERERERDGRGRGEQRRGKDECLRMVICTTTVTPLNANETTTLAGMAAPAGFGNAYSFFLGPTHGPTISLLSRE